MCCSKRMGAAVEAYLMWGQAASRGDVRNGHYLLAKREI